MSSSPAALPERSLGVISLRASQETFDEVQILLWKFHYAREDGASSGIDKGLSGNAHAGNPAVKGGGESFDVASRVGISENELIEGDAGGQGDSFQDTDVGPVLAGSIPGEGAVGDLFAGIGDHLRHSGAGDGTIDREERLLDSGPKFLYFESIIPRERFFYTSRYTMFHVKHHTLT